MTASEHLCECGCGIPTPIAARSKASRGHVKGQPMPRLRGHGSKVPIEQRFWGRVDKTGSCWLWFGKVQNEGYGVLQIRKATVLAHRFSYEALVGPIPEGLHIDHLCRVRNCVNPEHLEPVTPAENVRRGMSPGAIAARTNTCANGHVDQFVTYPRGARRCHPCLQEWRRSNRKAVTA